MEKLITPIILTGGTGTRLWPVSRTSMPKQFLPLFGELTTFQQALLRVTETELFGHPTIMTSDDFRFFVKQQAEVVGVRSEIVLEPVRRDSAAAIVAATLIASRRDPKALVLILAADHLIPDPERFHDACRVGREAALKGYIVTFGIHPTEPKTSYGYIQPGQDLGLSGARAVARFVEKPDQQKALEYMHGGYLWNSGNFIFRADVFLSEVAQFEPELLAAVQESVTNMSEDLGFLRLEEGAFAQAPQKSIDYAVMERTTKAAVVKGTFGWSDIGTWEGIYQSIERDSAGNAVRGAVVMDDVTNSIVHADGKVTALLGVRDLIVVVTPDAVLVAPRNRADDVKKLVGVIGKAGHKEAHEHRRVHRPWGYYESIDEGERFQVKRIVVSPGATLSLQKHLHRAEHWVVVRGVAEAIVGDTKRIVHENESVYVPMTSVHRLKNPGKIPLELIEVQTGAYLKEDDIERLDDVYKRT